MLVIGGGPGIVVMPVGHRAHEILNVVVVLGLMGVMMIEGQVQPDAERAYGRHHPETQDEG